MSKLLEDLPGRLDRLADGLTRTAVAPEPERLRARGRRWRRRRRAAGAGLVAALLAGAIFGVGRLSDLRPAPTGRPPTVTTTGSWPLPTMRFAARAPAGGQADAAALDAAARMLGTRLAAAGFTSSTVQVDDGGLLVTVAAVPGREQLVEELVERLAAPGQLQL
ncbi:MAG TPA: hypothetical protein VKG45_11120, partial [Actinomycetes bacterium]|nr:hypothetical protein [Actinomycetes bacterium]